MTQYQSTKIDLESYDVVFKANTLVILGQAEFYWCRDALNFKLYLGGNAFKMSLVYPTVFVRFKFFVSLKDLKESFEA